MSIREVQIQRVLQDTVRTLYSAGVEPTLGEILGELSTYFAHFPAGSPLPIDLTFSHANGRSDVDAINQIMARTVINLDTLYEATLLQVDDIMQLTSTLRAKLDRLTLRRGVLLTQIDDYLLSLYNTDGYFFSLGDSFSDTSFTDLFMTSAFVDTSIDSVTLPTISSLTTNVGAELVSLTNTAVQVTPLNASAGSTATQTNYPFKTLAPISGALDGLTNTIWSIQVETDQPAEVVVVVTLSVGNVNSPVQLSRVDFDPYGITEVQAFVEAGSYDATEASILYSIFGNRAQTSLTKMAFIATSREVASVRLTLRKTVYDYIDDTNNTVRYRYVFGAKEISMTQSVYDNSATFVSSSLRIPSSLSADAVIDAISITVDQQLPPDTSIDFFVANDPVVLTEAPQIGQFDWQPIVPVGSSASQGTTVVHFNGAQASRRKITAHPAATDLQLIAPDSVNSDLSLRNPSPAIIPGVDVYRICKFEEDILLNSLALEEGVNTTRIHVRDLTLSGVAGGLDFWAAEINGLTPPDVTYGKIDAGNEFFYGGDVGATGKSVYVETLVQIPSAPDTFIRELRKSDPNSALWDMKVFLNGRELGALPPGIRSRLIPWTFQQGLNHVALLVNIPLATADSPTPYIGTVALLGDAQLQDFGRVKLADWMYVSFFDLQYNQARQPTSFTIQNGEIISRRRPTTDFVISYARDTKQGPSGVRLRADLSRSVNNPHVTPVLDLYRMRFSYSQG